MASKRKTKIVAEAGDALIRVDASLRDRLKIYTIKSKVGMRDAANEAIEEYVKKRGA